MLVWKYVYVRRCDGAAISDGVSAACRRDDATHLRRRTSYRSEHQRRLFYMSFVAVAHVVYCTQPIIAVGLQVSYKSDRSISKQVSKKENLYTAPKNKKPLRTAASVCATCVQPTSRRERKNFIRHNMNSNIMQYNWTYVNQVAGCQNRHKPNKLAALWKKKKHTHTLHKK